MFLNISLTVGGWSATSDEFSLIFENNPVAEFVELPDHCYNLRYANILAGAIRGALEMTHIEVACWFVQVKPCFTGLPRPLFHFVSSFLHEDNLKI